MHEFGLGRRHQPRHEKLHQAQERRSPDELGPRVWLRVHREHWRPARFGLRQLPARFRYGLLPSGCQQSCGAEDRGSSCIARTSRVGYTEGERRCRATDTGTRPVLRPLRVLLLAGGDVWLQCRPVVLLELLLAGVTFDSREGYTNASMFPPVLSHAWLVPPFYCDPWLVYRLLSLYSCFHSCRRSCR
jgi:hypothetical protein